MVESMGDRRRYRHLNTVVAVDEDDRALLRTTLLMLPRRPAAGGRPRGLEDQARTAIAKYTVLEPPPEDLPNWAPLGSTYSLGAEILGGWGDGLLLARLYDGRPLELSAPAEIDDRWEVGDPLMVFFEHEVVVGWYLPDKQFGGGASGVEAKRDAHLAAGPAGPPGWLSGGATLEEAGRCLRCDGVMVLEGPGEAPRTTGFWRTTRKHGANAPSGRRSGPGLRDRRLVVPSLRWIVRRNLPAGLNPSSSATASRWMTGSPPTSTGVGVLANDDRGSGR